jgi:methyl-accepting chemotaxis protein
MEEIVGSIRRVTDIVGEISAASHEQTQGIEQINQAITQMDQVTQQNAALVEETAAASEAMREQAAGLSQAVSAFKIGNVATVAAPVRTPARPAAKPSTAVAVRPPQVKKVANAPRSESEWEEF